MGMSMMRSSRGRVTYDDASDFFNFLLFRGRHGEHILEIIFLVFFFNDHLYVVCMIVNIVNALALILSTILIWIIVGC